MSREIGPEAEKLAAMVNKFLNDIPEWLKREMFIYSCLELGYKLDDILAALDCEQKGPEPTPSASPASTRIG